MLKLKLQYFGHLVQRTDKLEKALMLGKIEGGRRRGRQRMRWLDSVTNRFSGHESEQTPGDSEGQRSLACCSPWGRGVRRDLAAEQQRPDKHTWDTAESKGPALLGSTGLCKDAPANPEGCSEGEVKASRGKGAAGPTPPTAERTRVDSHGPTNTTPQ